MKDPAIQSATLPDVMVRCGPLPPEATSFDGPVVLAEIVSPGRIARDRTEKWSVYRRLDSLMHYVLIERDTATIDVFDRTGEAWAACRRLEGLGAVLDLPALGTSVPLTEIYADVLGGA